MLHTLCRGLWRTGLIVQLLRSFPVIDYWPKRDVTGAKNCSLHSRQFCPKNQNFVSKSKISSWKAKFRLEKQNFVSKTKFCPKKQNCSRQGFFLVFRDHFYLVVIEQLSWAFLCFPNFMSGCENIGIHDLVLGTKGDVIWCKLNRNIVNTIKNLFQQLSKRVSSLGIMGEQLRVPLKPLNTLAL